MKHHRQVTDPVLAAMAGHSAPDHSGSDAVSQHNAIHCAELASLVSLTPHGGGRATEFSLPQAEHLGT